MGLNTQDVINGISRYRKCSLDYSNFLQVIDYAFTMEIRHDKTGWDDDAHFRFLHIKKEFQASEGVPISSQVL